MARYLFYTIGDLTYQSPLVYEVLGRPEQSSATTLVLLFRKFYTHWQSSFV